MRPGESGSHVAQAGMGTHPGEPASEGQREKRRGPRLEKKEKAIFPLEGL